MRLLIATTLLCICLSSCVDYRKTNRRHHKVQTMYSKNHPIILRDAIICGNSGGLKKRFLELKKDSILNVFLNAFQRLPFELKVEEGKYYCYETFIAYEKLKYRLFDFAELKLLAGNEENYVLIPVINYNYLHHRNMFITSTGGVGGEGGFSKNVHIELAALIFKNKELVYFKSRVFCSPLIQTNYSNDNIDFSIKQENIDTLVQLTMKDYIERMK